MARADESCVYSCLLNQAQSFPLSRPMKRDHIPDLLAYRPTEGWQPPVNRFMRRALENLQAGHHVYTRVEGGRLTQYCWLIEPRKSQAQDERYAFLPSDSVMLTDFYTYSQGRRLPRSSLRHILLDAAGVFGAKRACIAVPAGDGLMRQALEEAGFSNQSI